MPLRLLTVISLLALLIGGCGEEAEQSEIVLRVSNWGGAQVDSEFMRLEHTFEEEFETAHPGVRVQIEQIPGHGQYAPKLLMMHVADSVPDVVALDASSAAVFIDNDVLLDLAPFVERDQAQGEFDLGDYFENVTDTARRGDAVYTIPLDFTPMVMYYNKKLFDEAGVPYPQPGWNWDDFLETAKRLTVFPEGARSPTQYGMFFENVMPFWVLWLWTNGGDVLSPDGKRASGYFDGPRSVEAIEFLVDLMTTHRVVPHPRESAAAGVDLFRSGQAAMDLKGHWKMIDYGADAMDFGVVGLPTNGVERVTVVYASGLSITSKAKHPELAWEYIKHMTSTHVQVRRVASGLAISGNKEAAARFAGTPVEDAFLAEVQYARPPWGSMVERYPFIEELGREMMEDILYSDGELLVEEALRQTAKLIDAALAEQ
ncbi:MAG: sugar ABC transporter substrate-binding protein [Planctomycetes bacterium]|nr:sugar ABC transporter substrate-binding protein [Planctomycetota bacterium]